MRYALFIFAFLAFGQSPSAVTEDGQIVRIGIEPRLVLIERAPTSQNLSFDFFIENLGAETVRVARIQLSVYDRNGELQLRKFLTAGGLKHGDYEIAKILPKSAAFVFNPFESFEKYVALATLRYEFFFASEGDSKAFSSSVTVEPKVFKPKTMLILPLKGRILVHDGHDLYSHHRRFNLADPFLKEINVTHNFTRYASDLCVVNEKGDLRRNVNESNTDWYGFGVTVYAPGAGRIARVRSDVSDNIDGKSTLTLDDFRRDPTVPAGNFIIIDHLNGEYSLIAHLKQASVAVKQGDLVRVGQPIAQMGVSGDAYLPHVHYELRNASSINAEAFPAYFNNFVRRFGSRRIFVKQSPVGSGDILEAR